MYYVVINIAHAFIWERYNWWCASIEPAICTASVWRRRVEPRVLLHESCHYVLRMKIILADFNLAVSIQTAKLPNLIPRQIFQLYDTSLTNHNTIETGCSESSLFLSASR